MAEYININFEKNGQIIGKTTAELTLFSAFRCFPMTGDEYEISVLQKLVSEILSTNKLIALYRSGPFIDFLLDNIPEIFMHVQVVVDMSSKCKKYRNIKTVNCIKEIPKNIKVLFICDTLSSRVYKILQDDLSRFQVFTPNSVQKYGQLLPTSVWINRVSSIYPINIPDISFKEGLDLILLDLPARSGQQPSVGVSYVHRALERTSLKFQTIDIDPIWYHRFHMHRLLDLGCNPTLLNGIELPENLWDWADKFLINPSN